MVNRLNNNIILSWETIGLLFSGWSLKTSKWKHFSLFHWPSILHEEYHIFCPTRLLSDNKNSMNSLKSTCYDRRITKVRWTIQKNVDLITFMLKECNKKITVLLHYDCILKYKCNYKNHMKNMISLFSYYWVKDNSKQLMLLFFYC